MKKIGEKVKLLKFVYVLWFSHLALGKVFIERRATPVMLITVLLRAFMVRITFSFSIKN